MTFFDQKPVITVSGEGIAKAAPDLASFTITFASSSPYATEALSSEKTLRQSIVTTLTSLYGVDPVDMQVSFPQLTPARGASGELTYQAVNSLDVKFRMITSIDEAVAVLYKIDNLNVSNLVFTTNNARDLEDQAMKAAVADGKVRADKLAEASGKRLGRMVSLSAGQTQAVGTVATEVSKFDAQNPMAGLIPGQIQLTRNVTLVYEVN